jgi:PST family polysaccharide transporter
LPCRNERIVCFAVSAELSPAIAAEPAASARPTARQSSYGEILKSSTLIGVSTVLNLAIGVVRTKVLAVLLGPAGFGLIGVISSIADLARSLAEMGINSSGVRQIAEAAGSGDNARLVRTVAVLRRVAIVLGLIGALLLVLFARQISALTFGNEAQTVAIAVLSIAVFLRLVSDGQVALLQGMRRIGDMARAGVIGALLGTLLAIPIIYWLRQDGVVPALVAVAAASLVVSWWFVRRVPLPGRLPVLDASEVRQEVSALLGLGLAFMASGFLVMGAAYAVRMLLIRYDGLATAGLYQAAWTIGGLYVGFVLQAMGADFYPRLVAAASDNAECNRLVNEQAQVSLLLAGLGVIATLSFAPWVVTLLYSADFVAGTEVLRWITLGMAMRVITWPLGYILVAKGKQVLFVTTDLAWAIANVGLAWLAVRLFGLTGAGIAFLGSYLVHLAVVYPMARHLTGFRWSAANVRTGALFVVLITGVCAGFEFLPQVAMALGAVAMVASAVYSVHVLRTLVAPECVPRQLSWLLPARQEAADR